MLTLAHVVAVGIGAALGAIVRWVLGLALNHAGATLPWGTLLANGAGAFLIGVLLAFLLQWSTVPEWLRLFLVTGFLGGLTTFSTFSAESFGLLQRGEWGWAFAYMFLSLAGCLGLTALGFYAAQRWLAVWPARFL